MDRIGRERGWGPTSRAQFDAARGPTGNLFVGDPELVAEKIVAAHRVFGNDRFLLQMAIGPMPHQQIMRGIELYGTKVAPLVSKELTGQAEGPQPDRKSVVKGKRVSERDKHGGRRATKKKKQM